MSLNWDNWLIAHRLAVAIRASRFVSVVGKLRCLLICNRRKNKMKVHEIPGVEPSFASSLGPC